MLRASTTLAQTIKDSTYYADGRPSGGHLYYGLAYANNKIFRMYLAAAWGTGNFGAPTVDAFDLATNDWEPAGSYPNGPGGTLLNQPVCQHPLTGRIYTIGGGGLYEFDAIARTWRRLASRPAYGNDDMVYGAASAVDPVRNQILFTLNAYRSGGGLLYNGTALVDVVFTGRRPGSSHARVACISIWQKALTFSSPMRADACCESSRAPGR